MKIITKKYIICLVMVLLTVISSFAAEMTESGKWDMEKLREGKVLLEIIDKNDVHGVRFAFTVRGSKELIWEALTSSRLILEIFQDCDDIKVLEEDRFNSVITYFVTVLFKEYQYTLQHTLQPEIYRTSWVKHHGDFKEIEGFWQIYDTKQDDVFLVVSESFLETGFPVPGWILNLIKKSKTRELAREVREWVETHPDYLTRF